tara:strand:+ start:2152 stop:2745 length:594 start_codon:yes stop_codon:yes gene_type:complete
MTTVVPIREPVTITLELDATLQEAIQDLMPEVRDWPAVREFGVEVTRELVARIAITRGLKSMHKRPITNPTRAKSKQPEVVPDIDEPQVQPTPEPEPVEEKGPKLNANGLVEPPTGWSLWRSTERVPTDQEDVHGYYTRQGWDRWWGKVQNETISFYYSRDPELHDVIPFDGTGPNGKSVLVQKTPWGPGHIIPHKW